MYKMAAVYTLVVRGTWEQRANAYCLLFLIDNNPWSKLAKMSKNIKDFFKPLHSEAEVSCPKIPRAAVRAAQKELNEFVEKSKKQIGKKRGPYQGGISEDSKVKVAKYAAESGVSACLRHFKRTGEFTDLKESTVRGWMNAYKKELSRTAGSLDGRTSVDVLPSKRRGRSLLLGEELEEQVKAFMHHVRSSGGVINAPITTAVARGIVVASDANLLAENGGPINLTRDWAKRLLGRMGLVKRKASTTSKVTPEKFDQLKQQYLEDIRTIVEFEDIPPELIINWDQTAIKYVPVSNWTMEAKGSTRIEIQGVDDKRQITALLTGTMSGAFLPAQLIYKGKTPACLPKFVFPENWSITYNESHWANENTVLSYIEKVLLPYVVDIRKKQNLPKTQPALVIFDHFKGQITEAVFKCLEQHNIIVVTVPARCTDRLQPMDLSVNKSIKDKLKFAFQLWYAGEIKRQMDTDQPQTLVDLKLSRMKPLGAQWFVAAFTHVQDNPEIIRNGFKAAGIEDALK